MTDFKLHAQKLVKGYKEKRAMVIAKRRKSESITDSDCFRRVERYRAGLELLSDSLLLALKDYQGIISSELPDIPCSIAVISSYPEDLELVFTLKHHSLRFLTRIATNAEEFQNVLVDGMLFCESRYKGKDRKLEIQAGLWSDIGAEAWGEKTEHGEFRYFLNDLLPLILAALWNNATLSLVHSGSD